MTDIFISYASKDKNIADTICAKLEQLELKCWIAPRDIKPGEEYAAGIVRGIDNCKCMVIVFSSASNASKHVLREVERAVSVGAVVIPFRIEDIMPSDSMDYFLKVAHWLDAKDMQLEQAIDKLATTSADILQRPITIPPSTVAAPPKSNSLLKFGVAFLVLLGFAVGGFWLTVERLSLEDDEQSVNTTPAKAPAKTIAAAEASNQLPQFPVAGAKITSTTPNQGSAIPVTTSDEARKIALLDKITGQNKHLLNQTSMLNISSTVDISLQIPNHQLTLKAWIEPERSQFMEGDRVKFKTIVSNDAYLAVYVHSMDGSTYLIYPNAVSTSVKIPGERIFTVGNSAEFELEIAQPFGVDVVQFIATTDKKEFGLLLAKHTPLAGTDLATADRGVIAKEMQGIKTRGIKLVPPGSSATNSADKLWGETLVLLNTRARQ